MSRALAGQITDTKELEMHLQQLLPEWQKILRLQDWDVKLIVDRERNFIGGDSQGECSWVLEKKQAFIKILDPVDFPDSKWEQDSEETLVHELLHLHFAPFNAEDGTLEDVAQEQAISAIAGALAGLKRDC